MGTFSNNLLLSLLAFGESAANGFDNWGESANFNFGRLDAKLGGNVSLSLAGSDVTLSAANEALLQIEVTGTLPADRVVNMSTRPGFWMFSNQTDGGYTVTILPSGGTGLVLPSGRSIVYSDGDTPVLFSAGETASSSEVIYEGSSITLPTSTPLSLTGIAAGYRSIEIQGEVTNLSSGTNTTKLSLLPGDGSTWPSLPITFDLANWGSGESNSRPFWASIRNLDELDMSIYLAIRKATTTSVTDESYFLRPSYTGLTGTYDGRPITSLRLFLTSATAKNAAIRHLRITGHR